MAAPACPGTFQVPASGPPSAITAQATSKERARPASRYSLRSAWLTSVLLHAGMVGLLAAFMPVVNPSGILPLDAPVSVALLLEEGEALPPVTVLPPELQPSAKSILKMPEPEPEPITLESPNLEDVEAVATATPAASALDPTHGVVTAAWQQVPIRKQTPAPAAPETPKAKITAPTPIAAATASGGGGGGGSGTGTIGVGGGAGYGSGHGTGNGSGAGSGNGSGYGSGNGSGYGSGTGPGYGTGTGGTPAKAEAPKGKTCSARPKAQIAPHYPDDERRAGRTASVVLEVLVDEKGKLKDIRVLDDGGSSAFADSAIAAAKSARFEPAIEDGVPVASYLKLRIDYRLR